MVSWFEELTGFAEESPDQVRSLLRLDGNELVSSVNSRRYVYGELDVPSLADLRKQVQSVCVENNATATTVREVVADVKDLHADQENAGALFQVASQFNLLEMVSPNVTPERGVAIYENDPTQGPACAIAAGAGTIYRNYFVPMENGRQVGQTKTKQIDCLADLGSALGNDDGHLWKMKNGYCLAKTSGLKEISTRLQAASDDEYDELRSLLRIGVMWDTQVTLSKDSRHQVTQAFCSALPVAYSIHSQQQWSNFCNLVLEASYEATMCVAILNSLRTGINKVFLTTLGGGAFGNKMEWIISAMKRALGLYSDYGLDIAIVSYGKSNYHVQELTASYQ